jgi:hypothetical protein
MPNKSPKTLMIMIIKFDQMFEEKKNRVGAEEKMKN